MTEDQIMEHADDILHRALCDVLRVSVDAGGEVGRRVVLLQSEGRWDDLMRCLDVLYGSGPLSERWQPFAGLVAKAVASAPLPQCLSALPPDHIPWRAFEPVWEDIAEAHPWSAVSTWIGASRSHRLLAYACGVRGAAVPQLAYVEDAPPVPFTLEPWEPPYAALLIHGERLAHWDDPPAPWRIVPRCAPGAVTPPIRQTETARLRAFLANHDHVDGVVVYGGAEAALHALDRGPGPLEIREVPLTDLILSLVHSADYSLYGSGLGVTRARLAAWGILDVLADSRSRASLATRLSDMRFLEWRDPDDQAGDILLAQFELAGESAARGMAFALAAYSSD
jgi:hypothetical protein